MVLPAPGLLSTMTGWPSSACSGTAMSRATMSEDPPGAKVTTMRIGLAGQLCCAAALVAASSAAHSIAWKIFMSAPSVGGIAPRRAQQRHVVVLGGIGDAKAHRHQVEKAGALEIGADVEYQLIGARAQSRALEQRRVGASVGDGLHRLDALPRIA